MAVGDVAAVEDCTAVHYVDTGMYDTAGYGCAYVVDGDRPALVETGIGTHYERVLAALDEVGVSREDLAVIAPTHVHLDHAGGAGFLADACPNADVYVHEHGARHLIDPDRLVAGTKQAVGDQWQFYTEPEPVPADRVVELADGDVVDLGDRALTAHHAPGHAPHQVVFQESRDGAVFTADAAGIYVQPLDRVRETTPPPAFDLEQCLADVETVRDLDPSVLLYTHFGPAPAVDPVLDQYKETLEDWVVRVEQARARLPDDESAVAELSAETDVDDVWGEFKAHAETAMNVRGVLRYLDERDA